VLQEMTLITAMCLWGHNGMANTTYGNPSGTSARDWLGSTGVPQWQENPMIMALNATHVACAGEAKWEGGTRSFVDEADELRDSLCLLRSSEIPNPRSVLSSEGCRCSAQDHKWSWSCCSMMRTDSLGSVLLVKTFFKKPS